jgi:tetratricopeptide (TPR) repeat protein
MLDFIAETENIEALFIPGSGSLLLITFNNIGDLANGKKIWALPAAQRLNLPALGFMAKSRNWFPPDEMAELIQRAQHILQAYQERVSYGFSMGGYAAIKFSRLLNTSASLALAPQWSISPLSAPWEHRFAAYLLPWHDRMQIESSDCLGRIYLVFDDKHASDSQHADHIGKAASIYPIKASYCGHNLSHLFLSSAVMKTALDLVTAGNARGLSELVRKRRRYIEGFANSLIRGRAFICLSKRRLRDAEIYARRALDLPGSGPADIGLLSRVFVAKGDAAEAETLVLNALEKYPSYAGLKIDLSWAVERQGRFQEAIEILQDLQRRDIFLPSMPQSLARLRKKASDPAPVLPEKQSVERHLPPLDPFVKEDVVAEVARLRTSVEGTLEDAADRFLSELRSKSLQAGAAGNYDQAIRIEHQGIFFANEVFKVDSGCDWLLARTYVRLAQWTLQGRRPAEEAHVFLELALPHWRTSVSRDRPRFEADLANTLVQVTRLGSPITFGPARSARIREAVELWHDLAAKDPDKHRVRYSIALDAYIFDLKSRLDDDAKGELKVALLRRRRLCLRHFVGRLRTALKF